MNGDMCAYFGLNTSTRKLEDITCRLWESAHTWVDILKILMEQIESYKQCYVYNYSHIDNFLKLKKGGMNMDQNTKHAARKT